MAPKEFAGSIDIMHLLDGDAKDAILEPRLATKADAEIDRSDAKRPSIRACSKLAKDDIMVELVNYHIRGVFEDDEVWQCDRADVENGCFVVEKSAKKLKCSDGKERAPLTAIMHMKLSNDLQYMTMCDINTPPHQGQWDLLHLEAH